MLVQQEANGVRVFHVDNRKCWLYFWKAVFRIEVPKLGSIHCCIFSPFFILAQGPQFDAETAAMFVNTDELDAMVGVTNTTGSSRASSPIVIVIRIILNWIHQKRAHILEQAPAGQWRRFLDV